MTRRKADATGPRHPVLEALTAGALLLVLAALAWVVLAAYWPATFSLGPTEVEVVALVALLAEALLLVSVLALLQTRS